MTLILNRRPSPNWEHVKRILMELDVQEKSTGEAWGLSYCQMSFTSVWILDYLYWWWLNCVRVNTRIHTSYMFMYFCDTLVLVIAALPRNIFIISWLLWWICLFPCIFSQLIQGLIDGEEEFVREMKMFISQQLNFLDSSYHVPVNVLNQKEIIFRNIKDIVLLHERWYTRARSKAKCINMSNHSNRTRVFSGVSFLGWGSVPQMMMWPCIWSNTEKTLRSIFTTWWDKLKQRPASLTRLSNSFSRYSELNSSINM